jgi:hypothetical protein
LEDKRERMRGFMGEGRKREWEIKGYREGKGKVM